MEAQEIFDTVAKHLFAQGRQAATEGECRYRTEDGLKCAVGCLIPDAAYDPAMEGKRVGKLLNVFCDLLPDLKPHENLLCSLQRAHDLHWRSDSEFRGALTASAHRYGISPAILDTLQMAT